ncbi:MAG: hypothetical protein Q7T33_10200 [Dehalococcoidia bacterium]|nr:hypothetical protein [Dehalococcoidia bacterium]
MTTTTADKRDAILERLADGPAGQRILAELEAEALALRKAKAAQVAALTADFEAALPALVDACTKAEGRVEAAQKALETARAAFRAADIAESNLRARFARERDALNAELEAAADPMIDAFLGELSGLFERVRRTPIEVSGGVLDRLTERRSPITGNGPAIAARLAAINEARLQAEALKLEALTPAVVTAKLAALRESIEKAAK